MERTCWPEVAAVLPKDGTAAGVKPQAGALVDAAAGPASQEAVLCQIRSRRGMRPVTVEI